MGVNPVSTVPSGSSITRAGSEVRHGQESVASPVDADPTAGETGQSASTVVRTLGDFAVYRDGDPCPLPPGLPSQTVKYVIAKGGGVHSEVLIDEFWPEAGIDEGRKGMRNVLNRLGRGIPSLLVRDGELIRIAPGVAVDSFAFRLAADRVLLHAGAPGAVQAARAALARYGGPFLPDDPYSEWTERVREQLRRRHIALLDLVASDARRRGSMMEAVFLLEMAIEVDPVDEIRYLEAAEILVRVGRRGRATDLLHRSRTVLLEHGLQPGPGWSRIERALRNGELPPPDPASSKLVTRPPVRPRPPAGRGPAAGRASTGSRPADPSTDG